MGSGRGKRDIEGTNQIKNIMSTSLKKYFFTGSYCKICMGFMLLLVPVNAQIMASSVGQGEERITPMIQLRFSVEDSVKYVTVQVNESVNDTMGDPIPDLDIYLYVQRTFSRLPIGEYFNTTDENGVVRIEFPSDLPGDSAGNVVIIASVEEDDSYEGVEVSGTVGFGIPPDIDKRENKRSLAAAGANAPISLLLLVNGIILVVWGIIIYIFTEIYRIRRAE